MHGAGAANISRRDILKLIGAGALYALLPSQVSAASPEFGPSKGKGVIFVVGDGMPLGVMRAMHEIQTGVFGHKDTNLYARLKNPSSSIGYMATASLSSIVTDSAPASVAWATGVKTANRLLSSLPDGRPLTTILELAKKEGIGCGLVTTARVTHATPAAWYSHRMHRDLEDEIALDALSFKPDLLLGGGSVHFDAGKRKDKRDLFAEFGKAGYTVVRERKQLLAAQDGKAPLLGTFSSSHLAYNVDRLNTAALAEKQPSLAEMTTVALRKLSANPNGFVLQVEAARIDHASHSNDAWGAIMDTVALDETLGVIEAFLKHNPETLVIVTSDHGNSGWGINGTGSDYNDATAALRSYRAANASFEVIAKRMKGKQAAELVEIVKAATGFDISLEEGRMLADSMTADYQPYPGDFVYQPDATLGRILSHSRYVKNAQGKKVAQVRRGNVGFTSCNHTGEDQMVLAYGHRAKEWGLDRYVDNTYLFEVMCRFFGLKHNNPSMSIADAGRYLKASTPQEWQRHLRLHIA